MQGDLKALWRLCCGICSTRSEGALPPDPHARLAMSCIFRDHIDHQAGRPRPLYWPLRIPCEQHSRGMVSGPLAMFRSCCPYQRRSSTCSFICSHSYIRLTQPTLLMESPTFPSMSGRMPSPLTIALVWCPMSSCALSGFMAVP